MRRWEYVWIAALFVVGVGGLLRWVVFSPSGTAVGVIDSLQISAVVVGLVALFRWAVLRERKKSSDGKKHPRRALSTQRELSWPSVQFMASDASPVSVTQRFTLVNVSAI